MEAPLLGADEDLEREPPAFEMEAYKKNTAKTVLFVALSILSCGLVYLVMSFVSL
jgi:hypothetical protein